jgi:signal transduction histidine kinase
VNPNQAEPAATVVKCLLVDDLAENLLALRSLLRAEDVELLEARSGAEALELLLAHDVALVLLDVQMPEMDGFEVAELMRGSERTRNVPIIFITAGAHDQWRVFKGYESGAVDYLHKPIDARVLRNKVSVFFELHRRRQQLALQLREREQALRINEMFMAVLGHDLRSPLGAVRMGAELLTRHPDPAAIGEVAARIVSSVDRMEHLIEDLLDVVRTRIGGGLPVRADQVDLRELVQRAVDEQRLQFPGCEIAFASTGAVTGEWDGGRLAQLVNNLLGNALKHGSAGCPVRVQLDGTLPDSVRLTIGNAGVIPDAVRASLFDPFHGDRIAGRSEGLGLGLYIAQQIAQAHGGQVQVASTAADGTTASVVLPRRARRAAAARFLP